MRLTWLTINCSYSHSSLALPLLQLASSQLDAIAWSAVEALVQDSPASIARRVVEQAPDILCAPLYIFNREQVLNVLGRIKALCPALVIIGGGPECLGDGAQELLDHYPFFNYICSGEGEVILPEILGAITRCEQPKPGNGIYVKNAINPKQSALYDNWENAVPPMASPLFVFNKPFVQIETSRGCPFACQYCTSCLSPVRYKNLKAVADELKLAHENGIREIRLIDRTFNTPEQRCVNLLRLFRKDFPDIRFHLEIHPQFLTQAIRDELAAAQPGQLHIEAGIQSLHDDVLKAVGRQPFASQALDGLKYLVSCHPLFDTHCDLLAGLPNQTYQGLVDDLKTLVDVHPAEIQLEILKMLPGTPLRSNAEKLGIAFAPTVPYDVMQTPDMSLQDIENARLLSRMTDLFYNHPALTDVFYTAQQEQRDTVNRLFIWLNDNHPTLLSQQCPALDRRIRLLQDFFGKDYPAASFELDCTWLRAAHTPTADSPANRAFLIREIPPNAVLIAGEPPQDVINTKLWLLPKDNGNGGAVFAFNRAVAPNRAVAEWRLP